MFHTSYKFILLFILYLVGNAMSSCYRPLVHCGPLTSEISHVPIVINFENGKITKCEIQAWLLESRQTNQDSCIIDIKVNVQFNEVIDSGMLLKQSLLESPIIASYIQ